MTTFTADDFTRLHEAQDEIVKLGQFTTARFLEFADLTGVELHSTNPQNFWTSKPFYTVMAPSLTGEEVEVLVVTESLGGDRFGCTYSDHFVPKDFVFSDGTWEKNFEAAKAASFKYAGFKPTIRNT